MAEEVGQSDGEERTAPVREGVTVIGVGNWGASLLAALRGAHVPVCEVVHAAGPTSAAQTEGVALERAALDARILWLCVPDAAIGAVAERIVERRPRLQEQVVVHSSGALSSTALELTRVAGAGTGSVHPFMSFPSRMPVRPEGIAFGVEASEGEIREELLTLVRTLGGAPFSLTPEGKALYHAAGTLASPMLAALLAVALECCAAAGVERAMAMTLLGPIAARTLENIIRDGPEHSFSGPVARGDVDTVRLHLQALAAHPSWSRVYRSLAAASLELLPSPETNAIGQLVAEEGRREDA